MNKDEVLEKIESFVSIELKDIDIFIKKANAFIDNLKSTSTIHSLQEAEDEIHLIMKLEHSAIKNKNIISEVKARMESKKRKFSLNAKIKKINIEKEFNELNIETKKTKTDLKKERDDFTEIKTLQQNYIEVDLMFYVDFLIIMVSDLTGIIDTTTRRYFLLKDKINFFFEKR